MGKHRTNVMKNKLDKSTKLEKNAANKLAGDAVVAATVAAVSVYHTLKENGNHRPEVNLVNIDHLEKSKVFQQLSKQHQNDIIDKATVEPDDLKDLAQIKPTVTDSYTEQQLFNVTRYLEKMPSTELRQLVEGVIAQDNIDVSRFSIFIY